MYIFSSIILGQPRDELKREEEEDSACTQNYHKLVQQ